MIKGNFTKCVNKKTKLKKRELWYKIVRRIKGSRFGGRIMFLLSNNTVAKDAVSKKFIILDENVSLKDGIEIMLSRNLNDIFIKSKEELIGVLTLTDISNIKKNKGNEELPLKEYMYSNLVIINAKETLLSCRNKMIKNNLGRLPVVEDGKLIGVIREREIRKHFYMKIEEFGESLSHIINNIHEALCVIDKNGRVMVWNKKSEELYKVKSNEIIGKKIDEFFPDAVIYKVLKSKKNIENLYHSPRENSYVVVSAEPIYVDGEFVGVVSTDRDITEVRNLSQQLEKANREVKHLKEEFKKISQDKFGTIIGKSEKIISKIEVAKHVARTDASILITGESGTGKEVFARSIHEYSMKKGLFVPINCSAIPAELFESELFGYEGGAFTGANKKGKMGIFELANNGTVFLDEIGDMPLSMQAKLLRVLQEREIRRVGGEKSISVNVRVISATHRNLKEMVELGTFREDLYYRLNVVEIDLPPLRERGSDIRLLIDIFLNEVSIKNKRQVPTIDAGVLEVLENHVWKGNIRELKNTIEHMVVLSKDGHIHKDIIPRYIIETSLMDIRKEKQKVRDDFDLNEILKDIEIETIKKALDITNGNKTKASKLLNIPRTTLYYKIEQYEL